MKKKSLGVVLVLTIGLVLCTKTFSYVGKVVYVYGEVEILEGGKGNWIKCPYGKIVNSLDRIRTGASGKLILKFNDGSQIRIFRKTEFLVKDINMKTRTRDFNLNIGKIRMLVKKLKRREKFSIRTPTAVCAVRGTEFCIEVGDDEVTTVKIYAGSLLVQHNDYPEQEILVTENQLVELAPGIVPEAPKELPKEEQVIEQETKLQEQKTETRVEVSMDMTREQVQAAAAEEIKLAEFQQGKALVDVFGNRVRVEEYIVRPQPDMFKMVVLNERANRFDYFTWKATFNKKLPDDLSSVTKWVDWRSGTNRPEYYLKATESAASNTLDKIEWGFTGGHLVTGPDKYELLFNNYYFKLNNLEKIIYEPRPGITDITTMNDVNYYVNEDRNVPISNTDFWKPGGWWDSNIESTPKGYSFKDGSYKEEYFIIDDDGKEATQKDIDEIYNIFTGMFVKDKLLRWNFESVFSSPDFKGKEKKIDLVVEPKIFIDAGLLQVE